jgi:hypothetical protein
MSFRKFTLHEAIGVKGYILDMVEHREIETFIHSTMVLTLWKLLQIGGICSKLTESIIFSIVIQHLID